MRMAWVALCAAMWSIGSSCITPVIPFGGKSSKELQRSTLTKMLPAQLTPLGAATGEVRTAKLRVWADDQYRAQNVRWQHTFDEQIAYANQVLTPSLGIKLEPDYRVWEHHAASAALSDHLLALEQADPGEDAVWVIGLTSALSLAAATFDQLGLARLGGRHLVVRGFANQHEREAFDRLFPDLAGEEREYVLTARRAHKTTCVLLHELAHSLGALHETREDAVMNETYSHLAATIGERNRDLMMIELADRLLPPARRDPRAVAQQMLAALEADGSGWIASERLEQIENLRGQLGAGGGSGPRSLGATSALPPATLEELRRAEGLLARGDHAGASAALEPLVAVYPAHGQLRRLGCQIELARGAAKAGKPLAACDRAAELTVGADELLALAAVRRAAGDAAGARGTVALAEARLASLAPEAAATGWLAIAAHHRSMDAVTWAEAALAKAAAPAEHELVKWAATTRVRYGLPRDGARWRLAPEDDAAALAAVRGVLAQISANKLAAAATAAAQAEQRWPALPGVLAVRCDLELRRGAVAVARRLCERAIAGGGSSWALYMLGIIELRATTAAATSAGIARLREAIALDPDLGQAWRALGKALVRAKATAPYEELRRDYQARFGAPLPS